MIISFSKLGKYGRLGNQLFQLNSTLGLAEKHGAECAFPAWEYGQYFQEYLPVGPAQEPQVHEKQFEHYDWNLKTSCDLLGYMQSEKYFGSKRLHFKTGFIDHVKASMPMVFQKETICIHIRRGDYVDNENYVYLPINWYIGALFTHFPNWRDCNLLFLSNPEDIENVRTHFGCLPNAYFSKGRSDIEDLALGSACDHFIISNSSYAWWIAQIGEKQHSKIVHSNRLHAGKLANKTTVDYYPDRWIKYEELGYRIPLQDMTFTIPVFADSGDRIANVSLILKTLKTQFDSNIILMEQGSQKFTTFQGIQYKAFASKTFHRTRMLNEMAKMAETPFIANWDCDVIIPPMQIWKAVDELRNGADMVFPYDGGFARMPRDPWAPRILKYLDIGIAKDTNFPGRAASHNSVGGAVFFNKKSFIEGGMENENFISFGPEDCERNDRFKKLGYDVRRVDGCLFHVGHWVGVNSSKQNPFFAACVAEYKKVEAMSKEQLQGYVSTWVWRNQAVK
jgi:Glycosyl transferase family 11